MQPPLSDVTEKKPHRTTRTSTRLSVIMLCRLQLHRLPKQASVNPIENRHSRLVIGKRLLRSKCVLCIRLMFIWWILQDLIFTVSVEWLCLHVSTRGILR